MDSPAVTFGRLPQGRAAKIFVNALGSAVGDGDDADEHGEKIKI
jgi:hypothetical protein